MKFGSFFLILVFCAFISAEAEDSPKEGHSMHGETFNEGPRQQAVLLEGMPEVHFLVTTESDEAQAFFDQGIGQLHGFWYFEAERSFRQVLLIDPECAMAYWGMAMANFSNRERAPGLMEKAVELREKVSGREKAWIDALADYFKKPNDDEKPRRRSLTRAHEQIVRDYPDDVEAKAFLLHRIWENYRKIEIGSHFVVDLLAQELLEAAPNHPAHHYRIHLWDKENAKLGLDSAAALGFTGPGIAHLWHMPGHIYSKLNRYADAAWHQEASARVDHSHMIRNRLIPDEIHNFAHNNEWCIRNLNMVGRVNDAIDLAKNMISLPREPEFADDGKGEWKASGSSWNYGRIRLRDTLIQYEMWDELLKYADAELAPGPGDIDEDNWQRFTAVAAFSTGKRDLGMKRLALLKAKLFRVKERRDNAVADAKKKNAGKKEGEIKKATDQAAANFKKEIDPLQQAVDEVEVYRALAFEETQEIPELKGVSKTRLASLYQANGEFEKAQNTIDAAIKSAPGEVLPLAVKAEWSEGDEAKQLIDQMLQVDDQIDLEIGVFGRLGLSEEWRIERAIPEDFGERPELNSLGPFRWSPPMVPAFSLPDAQNEPIALAGFKGKPVLVIFYLGSGCVHCMEQLQAFGPMAEKYREAGIEILAVSTDTVAGLEDTFIGANYSEENPNDTRNPFPFPLVSDADYDVFQAYHAWDSFEGKPLHGTFLIDGEGRMRWKDISWEPFMRAEWLLEESVRLLESE